MGILSIALVALPFIPGLRDLPRRIPIYKLIWRDHYRELGAPPAPRPDPPTPVPTESPPPGAPSDLRKAGPGPAKGLPSPISTLPLLAARKLQRPLWSTPQTAFACAMG